MDLEPLRAAVGADGLLLGTEAQGYSVAGVVPSAVAAPAGRDEAGALIRLAAQEGWALAPYGGGTQIGHGLPPRRLDVVLSTRRMDRVVDYQPDDMTVTVEPGVTLAALGAVLSERGQFLPLNPPLPERSTVGGIVATAASGPWRAQYGTPRDWVIGCRVLGADGQEVRGGGQVVKNVAGYDLPKLYTGSFGTLGLLTEITFKVMPFPPECGVARVTAASDAEVEALTAALLGSDLQPASLEGTFDGGRWSVVCEFRHAPEAVAWQLDHLAGLAQQAGLPFERVPQEDARSLLRAQADRPASRPFLARMSTISSRAAGLAARIAEVATAHGAPPLVWASLVTGQVQFQADAATSRLADDLRNAASEVEATCVFPRLPEELAGAVDAWGRLGPELKLMQGLKAALDPAGLFNPGRFAGGI